MFVEPDRRPSGEAPITPSNVVKLRPEQPVATKRTRKPVERKYLWSNAARRDENLSNNAKVVAIYLGGLFDVDEEAAFPTHANIAKETGRSIDKVKRALRDLEAKGYLWRVPGAGKIGQNKYQPRWAKLSEVPLARNDVPLEECKDASPGGADLHGGECKDAREGSADLHPIIQAEYQREDKPEDKREHNVRPDAGAPEPTTCSALALEEEPVPSTFIPGHALSWRSEEKDNPFRMHVKPVEVMAAVELIEAAWPGNIEPAGGHLDNRGMVAQALRKGWSVDQLVAPIHLYAARMHELGSFEMRLVRYLNDEFDIWGKQAEGERELERLLNPVDDDDAWGF